MRSWRKDMSHCGIVNEEKMGMIELVMAESKLERS